MMLRVSGKNFKLGQALQTHIETRINHVAERFFNGPVEGSVVIDHEGSGYRAHCSLHLKSGVTLHTEASAQESYASFDLAADRLESRLRRYNHRLKDHHAATGSISKLETVTMHTLNAISVKGEETPVDDGFDPTIIAQTQVPLKPLSVSSAVIELDFTGAPVIFRHATSGRVNVVYRRPDGHVAWVDPSIDESMSAAS